MQSAPWHVLHEMGGGMSGGDEPFTSRVKTMSSSASRRRCLKTSSELAMPRVKCLPSACSGLQGVEEEPSAKRSASAKSAVGRQKEVCLGGLFGDIYRFLYFISFTRLPI